VTLDKVPFGFRPDVEDKPEPPAEEKAQQEISNTSCSTERRYSPTTEARVTTTDGGTWRLH
jgi:hypothetical protein